MAKVALTQRDQTDLLGDQPGAMLPTLYFIVIAPVLGLVLAYAIMAAITGHFVIPLRGRWTTGFDACSCFRGNLQLFPWNKRCAEDDGNHYRVFCSRTHMIPSLSVPIWVIFAAHAAIGLGTLSGGWRIVHTMGSRLTKLKPRGGFAAETAAAISILFASELGMPVSTTHVIAGAIAGVGASGERRRFDGVLPREFSGHGR